MTIEARLMINYVRSKPDLQRNRLMMLKRIRSNCSAKKHLLYYFPKASCQKGVSTKWLIYRRQNSCAYLVWQMFIRPDVTVCISVYSSITITPFKHDIHPTILCWTKYLWLCKYVDAPFWHDALVYLLLSFMRIIENYKTRLFFPRLAKSTACSRSQEPATLCFSNKETPASSQ
jgi:hypothetical protein